MSIKERKERERDERRSLILDAAGRIIATEGLDGLSIRKIADRIEYSPAIIYHYFQDKDDIINHLMKKDYQKIISVLSAAEASAGDPEQKLRETTRKYIEMALQMPEEYMALMFNSSPQILEHTSVLFKGASSKRQAIAMMCTFLKEIYTDKEEDYIELSAQIIWTSTFGLIIRLITEKDIDAEQKHRLIEHHINTITAGLIPAKASDRL